MRILITQDTDWIKRNPGQQHHLAERLLLRGHEIRVIDYEILWRTEGKKELLSRRRVFHSVSKIFKDAGITVIRPGILKIPILDYVSMLFTYYNEINKQIKEFMPDVIVAHSILTNYLAMRLSKKRGVPLIYHMNDVNFTLIPFKFLQPIGKIIENRILKNADRVVVINEKLREYAIKRGVDPEKIYLIRAGIDLERYNLRINGKEIRKKYGINKDDIVLFFMGWLYHFSGVKEVAMELSKLKDKNIKFLIVGDGDAFNDLQKIREKYNMQDKIILTGKQPYESIPLYIASSNICILPAYNNEVMRNIVPIKMYEYMAMGKPVITTTLPGIMKEFGNDNGIIYVDKPEDVLKKAIELIEGGRIEEEGVKARKFVEKYSWDNVVDQFEGVLEETIWY